MDKFELRIVRRCNYCGFDVAETDEAGACPGCQRAIREMTGDYSEENQ